MHSDLRLHRAKRAAAALGVALSVAVTCYGLVRGAQQLGRKSSDVSSGGTPLPSHTLSPEAERARMHSALLAEMVEVVFETPADQISNSPEYATLLPTLHAGASLEGIYRGLTSSDRFRSLEKSQTAASPRALELFGRLVVLFSTFGVEDDRTFEIDTLPGSLPRISGHSTHSAGAIAAAPTRDPHLPIDRFRPRPGQLTGQAAGEDAPALNPAQTAREPLRAETISAQFVGFSAATLRRTLGELALEGLERAGQKRAEVYVRWISGMCQMDDRPDFGLPARNRCDLAFHRRWADAATGDAMAWELLNRIHRWIEARD